MVINIHVFIQLTQVIAFFLVGVLANVDHQGFISIDCGSSTSSNYHGLNYTSDENYITTGTNDNVSSSFINTSDDDEGLYNTVRSFSGGTRSCYTLSPLKPNNKYLIRARFMYGNYDGKEIAPKFDVYIGVNFWDSIEFKELDQRLVKEIIHYSVSDSIDVCLVYTSHRSPFISALELRSLDEFAYDVASNFSLKLWNRWDVGRQSNSSNENDDAYNRLWYMHNWSNCSKVNQINQEFIPASDDPYKVPSGVLSTSCEQSDNSNAIANLTYSYRTCIYNDEIYVYWHFAELEKLGSNDIREFYIYVPIGKGYTFGPIRPKYFEVTTVKSGLIPLDGAYKFVFSLNKTDRSNLNPILNAVEMYKMLPLDASPTNQEDVDAINEIKKKYNALKFWQGDPCLPQKTQWDGLICDQQNPPRITSLNLNSRNLSGELPPSLFKLKSLESLNLANNGFTGKIPDFLAQMPSLIDIDLTGNNLTGPIPHQLLEKACNSSLSLRLEGISDACKMLLHKKRHRFIIPLVSSIAPITIIVIICVILFIYKRKQKQGIIYRTLKSRNKQFSYSDIVKMTDNFRKIIGKGAFGTVYYGLLQDGTQVSIKILNNTSSSIIVKQFCAEAELLTKIHHVNLVTLIGYCEERLNMALVYEYMSSGNLKMHLSAKNKHPLNWKTRLQISIDAAQGLEYLHSGCQPTIIHRDIKPENILLDEVGHAKISDFGLSRFFTTETDAIATTDIVGTLGYLDPEYCRLSTISDKSDVYGFGVVLLELITGKPPIIKQANQRDHRVHIIKWATEMVERGDILGIVDKRLQGEFSENTAWKLLEVAMACVNLISSQRPKMGEVVADLKMCYAYEGFKELKSQEGVSNENGCVYMSQPLDRSPMALLPDAR